MSCRCDEHHCQGRVEIAAGLASLPRSPGLFPAWRRALLHAVGQEGALAAWRAREAGDLGLMLIEMAAYVLDVAGFYDEVVANESYLPTARLTGAQRRLVSLLGYRPAPALGAQVWLAAAVDGTRLVAVPGGTAIRSGEFDGNPPQVFELEADATFEPRVNEIEVEPVRATDLPMSLDGVWVRNGSLRVRPGDLVVLDAGGYFGATRVKRTRAVASRRGASTTRIDFATTLSIPAGVSYEDARLLKPGSTSGLWQGGSGKSGAKTGASGKVKKSLKASAQNAAAAQDVGVLAPSRDIATTPGGDAPPVLTSTSVSLERRLDIRAGDIVAIQRGDTLVAGRVKSTGEAQYTLLGPLTSTIKGPGDETRTLVSPAISVDVTRLTFDSGLNVFSAADVPRIVVHYSMVTAADLVAPAKDTLELGDPIVLPELLDAPRVEVSELLLEDAHGEGIVTAGQLDSDSRSVGVASAPPWGRVLAAPVRLYGNAVRATRGESVHSELLGAGDASLRQQSFRLKKKPLTYLPAANALGRKSTLVIHVGGVRWREVESFFAAGDQDPVYTVRHDDEGNTDVHFGGGARIPSGAPVVADYRFGAGAALPPAGSVKQIARPVAGLRQIRNVLPAFGGADAEGPAELAVRGPRSALLLGRAISLIDIETAAAQQRSVRAARATWRWDDDGLQPAVVVSYIGDAQLAPTIQTALRSLVEEGAPLSVRSATAQSARLDVDVEIDPRYVPDDVSRAVGDALFAPVSLPGSGGLLRAERLGPDGVLFASVVVRAVMEVTGVAALRSLSFDGTSFVETARRPAAGAYFDFNAGGVRVNGRPAG